MDKKSTRLRRASQTRIKIAKLNIHRLSVSRKNKHMYAQIFSICGTKVLVSASTVEAGIRQNLAALNKKVAGGTKAAAAIVGKYIAERAQSAGIKSVAFDRSGFHFHGRVAALAQSARDAGLEF